MMWTCTTNFLTVLLTVMFGCSYVNGACTIQSVKTETTVFGTLVKYCEYEGLRILPGSNIINKDKCEEAQCTEMTFQVCGIGYKAGPMLVEQGCVVVPDGCERRMVSTTCQPPLLLPNRILKPQK